MKRPHGYTLAMLVCALPLQSAYTCMPASSADANKTLAFSSLPDPTPPIVHPAPLAEARMARGKNPSGPTLLHYQRAQQFKKRGDQNHALIELIKSTQENPKFVKAYYELAIIFKDRGYLKLAQSTLEQALAVKSDYSDARILLAALQIQQGNLGGAMNQLGQTIGLALPGKENTAVPETPASALVLQSMHSSMAEKGQGAGKRKSGETQPQNDQIKNFRIRPYPKIDTAADTPAAPITVHDRGSVTPEPSAATNDPAEPVSSFAALLHLKNPFSFFRRADNSSKNAKQKKKTARPKEHKKREKKKSAWFRKLFDVNRTEDAAPAKGLTSTAASPVAPPVIKTQFYPGQIATRMSPPRPQAQPAELAAEKPKTFQAPDTVLSSSPIFSAPQRMPETKAPVSQPMPESEDPWTVRLRYLAEHGTGTLKEGEAFMFSEDTGEATLFLADGKTVRRQIYVAKDSEEVLKERRPDIVAPDDLMYNVSLLAKLMPHDTNKQPASTAANGSAPQTPPSVQTQNTLPNPPLSNFDVEDLMGKSQGFWGWLKGVLKLSN